MAGTNSIVAANGTHLNRKGSMHQQTFHGMLSYTKSDEQSLVRNLIIDLKPVVAATMMPNLPSYVILMCIRHCDHLNDDFRVRSLLHEAIVGVKKAIKKRFDDAENVTLWLSNCVMLLQLLKQYSGEEVCINYFFFGGWGGGGGGCAHPMAFVWLILIALKRDLKQLL